MQKNINKIKVAGGALSPEEKKEQAIRAFMQKRNSVAEMVISQTAAAAFACGSDSADADELVAFAIAVGDAYMERALGLKTEPAASETSSK